MRKHIQASFTEHAKQAYPHECCGLIVKQARRHLYVPCENVATDPAEEFRISALEYAAAEDMGAVIGLCHSHPDATSHPSNHDIAMCNSGDVPWHILSWPEGDLRTIVPEDAPLLGRPFVHGTDYDCYGLIRGWYKQNRGVELPQFPHDRFWWETEEELYLDHYREAGFEQVLDGSLEVGDVILMQVQSPRVNHGAVYVGDGMMLHHLFGRHSGADIYGGYWLERTRLVVRYVDSGAE